MIHVKLPPVKGRNAVFFNFYLGIIPFSVEVSRAAAHGLFWQCLPFWLWVHLAYHRARFFVRWFGQWKIK